MNDQTLPPRLREAMELARQEANAKGMSPDDRRRLYAACVDEYTQARNRELDELYNQIKTTEK